MTRDDVGLPRGGSVFGSAPRAECLRKQTPVRKSRHVVSLALHHLETEGQGHGGVTRETVTRETRFAEG